MNTDTSTDTESNQHQDIFGGTLSLLIVLVLAALGLLLFLYFTKAGPSFQHADFGTLGDFIGGLMNPLLTFLTVALLIFTMKQNRDMINQNQKVIELNTLELEKSTAELNSTQEALHKDAAISEMKFQFEIIDIAEKAFRPVLHTSIILSDSDLPIGAYLSMTKGDEYRSLFVNSFMHSNEGRERIEKVTFLYTTYIEAVEKIVGHVDSLKWHFLQHGMTKDLYNFYEAHTESEKPLETFESIKALKERTDKILQRIPDDSVKQNNKKEESTEA